jgi:hypothetical protein
MVTTMRMILSLVSHNIHPRKILVVPNLTTHVLMIQMTIQMTEVSSDILMRNRHHLELLIPLEERVNLYPRSRGLKRLRALKRLHLHLLMRLKRLHLRLQLCRGEDL